jgi:hypothetical protein
VSAAIVEAVAVALVAASKMLSAWLTTQFTAFITASNSKLLSLFSVQQFPAPHRRW